ncbi:MAG: hypothetical protein AB3N12_01455 [Ruegeria sp.]
MCIPIAGLGLAAGAGATAATGATAAATTGLSFGTILQTVGAVVGVVGALNQGTAEYEAATTQVADIDRQKTLEAQLNATEEQRTVQQFQSQIAQQRADLVARGVSLDSPTAVYLGQTAAREMVFEAQSIRQGGFATQEELTSQQRALRAHGQNALIRGRTSAAGTLLTAAPKIWPELLA